MNSCKVVLAQSRYMKLTWLTARGGGAGRLRFQVAKKRPVKGEDINSLVSKALKEDIKPNKRLKAKASNDSGLENKEKNFNFETLKIGE